MYPFTLYYQRTPRRTRPFSNYPASFLGVVLNFLGEQAPSLSQQGPKLFRVVFHDVYIHRITCREISISRQVFGKFKCAVSRLPFATHHVYARPYIRHAGALDSMNCGDTGRYRGLNGGNDRRSWSLTAVMARRTARVWALHGYRLGLVLIKPIPTKQPPKLPQGNVNMTMATLEGYPPLGYTICAFLALPSLDEGVVWLSDLCCTGFDSNLKVFRGYVVASFCHFIVFVGNIRFTSAG